MRQIAGITLPRDPSDGPEPLQALEAGLSQQPGGPHAFREVIRPGVRLCEARSEEINSGPGHELPVVLTGHLYNRPEIFRELGLHPAAATCESDAALVWAAYQRWGVDCIARLSGEFAFILWDAARQELLAARDAVGTRQLYWTEWNGGLAVASDIAALLGLPIRRALDTDRLLDCLVEDLDRSDQTSTLYLGISRLPAGHALLASPGSHKIWRHWHPTSLPLLRLKTQAEQVALFRDTVQHAVDARLERHPRAAAMLSGGLDSSLVVGLAHQRRALNTYTLSQAAFSPCSDTAAAQLLLAALPGLKGRFLSTALGEQLAHQLNDHLQWAPDPFPLLQGHTYRLAYEAAAADGADAVLDGMAGDVLFFPLGERLPGRGFLQELFSLPASTMAVARHGQLGTVWPKLLKNLIPDAMRPNLARQALAEHRRRGLFRQGIPSLLRPEVQARVLERLAQFSEPPAADPQQFHAQHFTTGMISFAQERNNHFAVLSGIEPLSPLADRRVVELMISFPAEFKLAHGWYKPPMRQAAEGLLLDPVRWRRSFSEHPGSDMCQRLARTLLLETGSQRVADTCLDVLHPWIDAKRLLEHIAKASADPSGEAAWDAYRLFAVSLWLQSRSLV